MGSLTVLLLIVSSALALPSSVRREHRSLVDSAVYKSRVPAYDLIIDRLRDHGLDDRTVLTSEPGYLAYHTRQPVIDRIGLVTPTPAERGEPLVRLVAERRPDLIILDSETGDFEGGLRDSYLPLFQAQPSKPVLIRREVYGKAFDGLLRALARRRLPGREPPVVATADSGRLRGQPDPWLAPQPLQPLLRRSRPIDFRFGGQPVEDRYLHTFRRDPGWVGTLWSDPFLVDFDELTFRFAGTGGRATRAQLFVDGLPVTEIYGTASGDVPIVEMREVVMPVHP